MRHLALAISLIGLIVASIAFVRNQPDRDVIAHALRGKDIPERMVWGYSAQDMQEVIDTLGKAEKINGQSPLERYVRPVLYWNDIVFAIALAIFSASLWLWILLQFAPTGLVAGLMMLAGVCAVLYGVTDVAEDVMLARILAQPKVSEDQVRIASNLTGAKIVTNAASVTAAAVFLTLSYWAKHRAKPGA